MENTLHTLTFNPFAPVRHTRGDNTNLRYNSPISFVDNKTK